MQRNALHAAVIVLLAFTTTLARAATFYVATTGSDSNPGTQAQPFFTIGQAIAASQTGDTVLVADGTYSGAHDMGLFADVNGVRNVTLKSVKGPANCVIDAHGQGRVMVFQQGETAACHVEGFTVKDGSAGADASSSASGGAIYIENSSPTIENCIVSDSVAPNGGGVGAINSQSSFIDCTITANSAVNSGNDAAGGGMVTQGGSVTLTNCVFSNNTIGPGALYPRGAGIAVLSGEATFIGCNITGNTLYAGLNPSKGGGFFFQNAQVTLTGCSVTNNTVYGPDYGHNLGGGGGQDNGAASDFENCEFDGNTVTGSESHEEGSSGGGMSSEDCTLSMNGCQIISNLAQITEDGPGPSGYYFDLGGGVYVSGGSGSFSRCLFQNNQNLGPGSLSGGLELDPSSTGSVVNCLFVDNLSSTYGGSALGLRDTPSVVKNCTFTGNKSQGGGDAAATIVSQGANQITNCILWNNPSTRGPIFTYTDSGVSPPIVTYSDVEGGHAGTGNIDADPQFVDPANGNYHLQPASPCIDRGTNVGAPSTDYDGLPRPYNGLTDMGAYEWQPTDLYVNPAGGSDSNPGTAAAPFKTVNKAVQAALPGYTVHMAGGAYLESLDTNKALTFDLWNSGIADVGTH